MALHEVVIHENTGATKESAPYLGNYISKETIPLRVFADSIGAKCGIPPIQVIALLDGSFRAFEDLERESLVRIHTDLGVVCGVITGSFPTADAEFDRERNSLELALRLVDEIKLDLADTVPTIVTDADLTKLRVDNVMDMVTPRPMNLIHGQNQFRVAGFNMVLDDEGAGVFLTDSNGTTYEVVVDEVKSKQLFIAHTAEALPGGDYKLVVKSRAGDAGGPLQMSFRRVKYLHVESAGPTLTSIKDASIDEEGKVSFYNGGNVTVSGTGLAGVTCDDITLKLVYDNVTDEQHPSSTGFSATDTALVFASGMLPASQEQPDGSWVDGNVTLILTKDGKTVELPFDYV